jgi:hypothetical protein
MLMFLRRAMELYSSIGQRTVRLNKEMPGHVADRLQTALGARSITLLPRVSGLIELRTERPQEVAPHKVVAD